MAEKRYPRRKPWKPSLMSGRWGATNTKHYQSHNPLFKKSRGRPRKYKGGGCCFPTVALPLLALVIVVVTLWGV
jgi:hypothetical protein